MLGLVWEQKRDLVASFGEFIGEVEEWSHVAECKPWEHGYVEL